MTFYMSADNLESPRNGWKNNPEESNNLYVKEIVGNEVKIGACYSSSWSVQDYCT